MKGRRGDLIRTALGGGPVARQAVSRFVFILTQTPKNTLDKHEECTHKHPLVSIL